MRDARVFISYRRRDDPHAAARVCDALAERLGEGSVFMDVDSIPLGEDFRSVIEEAIARCDAVICVIGDRWLAVEDAQTGRRRIDDPLDYVRLEIEAALRQRKLLVPVLVGESKLPKADVLPESIRPIVYLNACDLRFNHFDDDLAGFVQDLSEQLERATDRRPPNDPRARRSRRRATNLAAAILAACLVGAVLFAADDREHEWSQNPFDAFATIMGASIVSAVWTRHVVLAPLTALLPVIAMSVTAGFTRT